MATAKTSETRLRISSGRHLRLFVLHNGTLLSYEIGNKKSHELPMLRKQWSTFKVGDIFLGDKGFCSYFDVFSFQDKGVDSVITLARRKPVIETEAVKKLGEDNMLIFTCNAGMLNCSFGTSKPPWIWIFCAAKRQRWCASSTTMGTAFQSG